MATIEEAFDVVCKTFRISALTAPQKNGITKIVEERRDVFINLPTGFGEERCVTILKTAARETTILVAECFFLANLLACA